MVKIPPELINKKFDITNALSEEDPLPIVRVPFKVKEWLNAGDTKTYGLLMTTLDPAAITTSSAEVGSTPPTHVDGELQSPPMEVLLICAIEKWANKNKKIVKGSLISREK